MEINEVLENMGLTPLEVKVYLAILEQGTALASIISRRSGIHRRCVYDAVERLIQKGLVGYIVKNNRRYYSATNPDRLMSMVMEKEMDVKDILPELHKKFGRSQTKPETSFFQGMNGLKIIYEDMIEVGEEILVIAASTYHDVNRFFFPKYDILRNKQNIKVRVIFSENMRKTKPNIPLAKIRFLPEEYVSTVATNIYGDNVTISLWTKNPVAILIRQKEIAENYRRQFELLWKIAKS